MRAKEFINENATAGATVAGSVATVSSPVLSTLVRRVSATPKIKAKHTAKIRKH